MSEEEENLCMDEQQDLEMTKKFQTLQELTYQQGDCKLSLTKVRDHLGKQFYSTLIVNYKPQNRNLFNQTINEIHDLRGINEIMVIYETKFQLGFLVNNNFENLESIDVEKGTFQKQNSIKPIFKAHLPNLKMLALPPNSINQKHFHLFQAGKWDNLQSLFLKQSNLANIFTVFSGIQDKKQKALFPSLKCLSVIKSNLCNRSMKYFKLLKIKQLKIVNFSQNLIGIQGLRHIIQTYMPSLQVLNLSYNFFMPEIQASKLLRQSYFSNIRYFSIFTMAQHLGDKNFVVKNNNLFLQLFHLITSTKKNITYQDLNRFNRIKAMRVKQHTPKIFDMYYQRVNIRSMVFLKFNSTIQSLKQGRKSSFEQDMIQSVDNNIIFTYSQTSFRE